MKNNNIKRPILAENIYLTKSEKNILDFINMYELNEFYLTQAELAKASNSSEASISRFIRKYGLKDYRSFIASINAKLSNFSLLYPIEYDNQDIPNPFTVIHSSYKYAIDSLNNNEVIKKCSEAARIINSATNVLVYGSGSSQRISIDLVANLIKLGKPVVYNSDFHIFFPALANVSNRDVLIVFSNNLISSESNFVISNAKKRGTKVIAITSKHNEKTIANVDVLIQYQKIHNASLLVPVSSKVSQMLIANMLFETLINDYKDNYAKLQKSSKLIDEWANIDKIHSEK
ncbi:MurR/RpiR family transcriptional regulator [Mycoplasmopsis primatum]|uniref:MurR/RpiR family transcriptional regulator n=1 Tax=Mycoplasmopsis primatum TaxID=55604 RepID=UPI0004962A55|nr:MurR/RpiR family transcriptional regulator [Mycoplasmopsis primatum]